MVISSNDLQQRIETALDSIRDYLRSDGGNVVVREIDAEAGVVKVELMGNCESCSMSSMTMKAGVEQVIFRVAPEITRVEAINGR